MRSEFTIGFLSGLRTFTPPALVSHAAHHSAAALELRGTPLSFLASGKTACIFAVFAAGELIADKLPHTPARTEPGPLTARILSGGLCGAALSIARGRRALGGCLFGAVGALAGAFAGYQVRKRITHRKRADIPDFPVALIEDAITIGGADCLLRQQLLAP